MRRFVVAILLVLALASCSAEGPALTASKAPPSPSQAVPTDAPAVAVPRVLIFGDSYTAGEGAADATEGYAYRMGPAMGWDVTVDGVGGTGYVNTSRGKGAYLDRLAASDYTDSFDIVLIEGGTNDQGTPATIFSAAVDDTLTVFADRFPRARIIMLGLFSWERSIASKKTAVNTALRAAAAARGFEFVDSLTEKWFTASDTGTLINSENNHPNADGYAIMAARLTDDLRAGGSF